MLRPDWKLKDSSDSSAVFWGRISEVCGLQVSGTWNVLLCVPRLSGGPTVCADEAGRQSADAVLRSPPQQETGTTNYCADKFNYLFGSVEHKKTNMTHHVHENLYSILRIFVWFQVTSGSLAVYLSRGQEVWLETKDYRGMRGKPAGYSIFSGFLLHSHWPTGENIFTLRLFYKKYMVTFLFSRHFTLFNQEKKKKNLFSR